HTPRGTRAQFPIGRRPFGSCLYAPGRSKWADFDRVVGCLYNLARPRQRCIEVVRVDDVEPCDMLLRLNVRPISHERVTITQAEDGRCVGAMECATEDECTAGLHLSFKGSDPLHESLHLLGRPRCPRDLALDCVRRQQVLTHDSSSGWCGPFPRSSYLRMG